MLALSGVAQWIERQPVNQRVMGFILSQGTFLGYRPGPQWGARERQPHIDVSLPLFLPPFPSLKKEINKVFKKKHKRVKSSYYPHPQPTPMVVEFIVSFQSLPLIITANTWCLLGALFILLYTC